MSHDYKYVPVAGASNIPSNQLKDDELFKLGVHELAKRLRKSEGENIKLMSEHGSMMKDINRRMQIHLMEIRTLKEVNQKLQDDSQELRDLCCFLDDDRQKGRKLAREWQRFGRYTASVMRQEVSAYQGKLRDLEGKQQDLMKDNLELKELCLYLDEERVGTRVGSTCTQCGALLAPHGLRDEGDGSSSSTNNDEPLVLNSYSSALSQTVANSVRERLLTDYLPRQRSNINEQILHYIKGLEQRVQQLEEEKQTQKYPRTSDGSKPPYPPPYRRPPKPPSEMERNQQGDRGSNPNRRPEAVIHAMKVLELHEQLEKEGNNGNDVDDLGNREKALVKEMCNVVWRTLEDVPPHL